MPRLVQGVAEAIDISFEIPVAPCEKISHTTVAVVRSPDHQGPKSPHPLIPQISDHDRNHINRS